MRKQKIIKGLILIGFMSFVTQLNAQNFQFHYEFGKSRGNEAMDRNYFTTTLEMFKPDKYGSTFWFVDFEHNFPKGAKSMSLAYWEIAREFYIPGLQETAPLNDMSVHVEYNDGIKISGPSGNISGITLGHVWLFGLSYPIKFGDFKINTMLLYRNMRNSYSKGSDFQFTATWTENFLNEKITCMGFFDIWTQGDTGKKDIVVISEPQFWYNFGNNLSIGGEIEISKNFIYKSEKWEYMPTVAGKWTF